MEKEHSQQLELFSQLKSLKQTKVRISKIFISYISRYEKTILITIGFIVTGIISFSLGVEKGKSFMILKTDAQLDIAVKPSSKSTLSVSAAKPTIKGPQSQPVKQEEPKEYMQNYTVQVASFLKRINAQEEAEMLKKKGLSPQILSKGKFSIVCIGNFSKREEAESLLPKLRKQYRDCLIRRL